MNKTVLFDLGKGSLFQGFSRVVAQLWTAGHPLPEQYVASLPPAPQLIEVYRNWQITYQNLYQRCYFLGPPTEGDSFPLMTEDDELEISAEGITNVSLTTFNQLCDQLQAGINHWLVSESFLTLEQQVRSHLHSADEIHVIIETNDEWLRRLPWEKWNFFQAYPNAEMALFSPVFRRQGTTGGRNLSRKGVRILAILGDYKGIDLSTERQFLASLPDATVEFLVQPSISQINNQLSRAEGWDILFFAGHSRTEGGSGTLYLNEDFSGEGLSLQQVEESLKTAIEQGLKLAIFNSCDGLGLANELEKLHIPVAIVMREPVPNQVAQHFLKHFLTAYSLKLMPLYLAVQFARQQLLDIEEQFPGASWLPVICQNPAISAPSWLQLGGVAPCPYRGLLTFREKDANFFFGREQIVEDLLAMTQQRSLVAVVGASGSGKSSVLFAGLVPHLRKNSLGEVQPFIASFRPGYDPFGSLASAITQLLDDNSMSQKSIEAILRSGCNGLNQIIQEYLSISSPNQLFIIADQFEELFTLCAREDQQPFLDVLLKALSQTPGLTLVITLRADFYGRALDYRPFSDALQGAVLNLGPMSQAELVTAIEKPAAQVQVSLEPGLSDRLVQETGEQSGHLPLLQFALTQLWLKQQVGQLTHRAYEDIGGVEDALTQHAEGVYSQLSISDQERTQRMFIQLVQMGDELENTRRLATEEEVRPENWDLVTQLATARLVVSNCDPVSGIQTVELAHEALIHNWQRLKYWIQVDGEFRRWQEKLRVVINIWDEGQDKGALLRGKALLEAESWLEQRSAELSQGEQAFIQSSQQQQDRQSQQEKQRQTLLTTSLGVMSVALFGALALGGTAFWQSQRATQSQIEAIAFASDSLFTLEERLPALIQALEAKRLLKTLPFSDSGLESQVNTALLQAIYGQNEFNRIAGDQVTAFSPDGKIIVTANISQIMIWDPNGQQIREFKHGQQAIWGLAFSPNRQLLASASQDNSAKIWTPGGKLVSELNGHKAALRDIAFSPDGTRIATASDDNTVKLWTLDGTLIQTFRGHKKPVWGLAFHPTSNLLASSSYDTTIQLWDLEQLSETSIQTLTDHDGAVSGVAFSPDGQTLASASHDKSIKLWRMLQPKRIEATAFKTLKHHTGPVSNVAFSPTGQSLAAVSYDRNITHWDLNGVLLQVFQGHTQRIWHVAFSPDGQTLATSAGVERMVRLWRLQNPFSRTLNAHKDVVLQAVFSPDGQIIASSSDDSTVKLWSLQGNLVQSLDNQGSSLGLAFHPNNQLLASVSWGGLLKVWDRDPQTQKFSLRQTRQGQCGVMWQVSFSADGQHLVSTCQTGEMKMWSSQGELLKTIQKHKGEVKSVDHSADNQFIVSTGQDSQVKLWKIDGTFIQDLMKLDRSVSTSVVSPDSRFVAAGGFEKIVKLKAVDGSDFIQMKGHEAEIKAITFHPDGQLLASASADKTLKLWNLDGTEVATLKGHSNSVWDASFNHDGSWLASASEDGTAKLWKLDLAMNPDQLFVKGCHWANYYLTYGVDVSDSDRNLCDSN